MTDVTYSERWSDLASGPTDLISEETARERYQSGEPYTVTIGTPEDPDRVIDVAWKERPPRGLGSSTRRPGVPFTSHSASTETDSSWPP